MGVDVPLISFFAVVLDCCICTLAARRPWEERGDLIAHAHSAYIYSKHIVLQ